MLFQINAGCQPAQPDLDNHQIAHKFHQVIFRKQKCQPVQRTGQIINIQCQEIGTDPYLIRIGEPLSRLYFPQKLTEERHILMVHIRKQKASVSEGINAVDDKNGKHDKKGDSKCCR